jgi:hypothetical protein
LLGLMIERQVPINRDWNQWLSLSKKSADVLTNLIKRTRDKKKLKDVSPDNLNSNNPVLTKKGDVREFVISSKTKKPASRKSPPQNKSAKLNNKIK